MPANINFPEFTDEEVFLEDMDAANELFGSLTVSNATTVQEGVVKKAAAVTSLDAFTTKTITSLRDDGSYEILEVVDKAELDTFRTKFNDLLIALQNAGIMS